MSELAIEQKSMSSQMNIENAVVAHSRASIRRGSKSFSFASRLLAKDQREAAMMLYAWCRYCDDRTDIKDRSTGLEIKEQNLKDLIAKTACIYEDGLLEEPEFAAMRYVVRRYKIPGFYPAELLKGMEMDLYHKGFETLDELLHYCYRVAGVVGLMMVHVLQVSDESALAFAQDMGMAMQLTNIARDIVEDAEMGRIYIPRQWLLEIGLNEADLLKPTSREKLAVAAKRLVTEAERLYRSGDKGIAYLPIVASFSIVAARQVYSAIGRKVVRRGAHAWDTRTWIPRWRKFLMLFSVGWTMLLTVPQRLRKPWSPVEVHRVRLFQ